MAQTRKPIRSQMGWSTRDRIEVQGLDLCQDLIGHINLGDMAFLEMTGRRPNPAESAVFNAILVTLVEHGLTPMALATRLTYMGAPESLQGAVASGLLGMGTTFAGTTEGSARMLTETLETHPDMTIEALAEQTVASYRSGRRSIPGIGHNMHKPVDPRAERLFDVAALHGFSGRPSALMRAIAARATAVYDRGLPVNATGAIGAISCELGLDWRVARGLAVMGRAVGLVGHLVEELRNPIAPEVWLRAEEESHDHYQHQDSDHADS
ncbi:MAG: citryl-CoA lyase [Pigmentiphaga sp.]